MFCFVVPCEGVPEPCIIIMFCFVVPCDGVPEPCIIIMFCFVVPCDGVPEPCIEGQKYADATDCYGYFECISARLVERQCQRAQGFDIIEEDCVALTSDFNCEYRCLTTAVPETTEITEFTTEETSIPNSSSTSQQPSSSTTTDDSIPTYPMTTSDPPTTDEQARKILIVIMI